MSEYKLPEPTVSPFEHWWDTCVDGYANDKDLAESAYQAGRDATREETVKAKVCLWNNADECWETTCGHSFEINDGTPAENDMKYCCYCGGKVEEDIK